MTWAAALAALNDGIFATFGEDASYQAAPAAAVACRAVVRRSAEPILVGGDIVIDEDHYTALVNAPALTTQPVAGATLTVGAVVYGLRLPGQWRDGAWHLILELR